MPTPDSNAKFMSVDSSIVDLTEKKSSRGNDKTAYFTADEILNSGNINPLLYKEVSISQSDFNNMGTTPIALLGAPGAGKYYDIDKIAIEYTYGSAVFTSATTTFLSIWDSKGYLFNCHKDFLTNSSDSVWVGSKGASQVVTTSPNYAVNFPVAINSSIELSNYSGEDFGGGTGGSALAKIWYKVRTVGTEL